MKSQLTFTFFSLLLSVSANHAIASPVYAPFQYYSLDERLAQLFYHHQVTAKSHELDWPFKAEQVDILCLRNSHPIVKINQQFFDLDFRSSFYNKKLLIIDDAQLNTNGKKMITTYANLILQQCEEQFYKMGQ